MTQEETLYQLLKKERGYYSAILEITRQENEKLLLQRPLTEVTPLLKQKKILLSCIADIENALNPLKKYWQDKKDRTDALSLKIKEELTSLDHLLREILQLDLISQKSLEAHLQYLQDQTQYKKPFSKL